MKKLLVVLSVLFGMALVFGACSEEEKADLGWANGSAGKINEIVWSGDGTEWANGDVGYEVDEKTGSKEVTGLTGEVNCALWVGGSGWDEADVVLENNNNSNVLSLDAGGAYEYTIEATAKK